MNNNKAETDKKEVKKSSLDHWRLSPFEELELENRTQKPPTEELIKHLNRIVSKPPFSWICKYKENMPR